MQYRIDKKSGNKLSILGFSCARLPNDSLKIDVEKSENLIIEAIGKGINYFDTAYVYPESEVILGQILQKYNLRERVYIATKLPLMLSHSYGDFDECFNIQLERLGTNYIDYYLMHVLNDSEQWGELCGLGIEKWINEKKASGQIKHIGFSFHGQRDDFTTLLDVYDWDFCQIQYNYININYQAGISGLKKASAKGLPVFVTEPLLGGKLATSLPEDALDVFEEADSSISPASWALRWLWNQPEVTIVLSCMSSSAELDENLDTAKVSSPNMLSEKELSTIDEVIEIFNESYKIPCTGCNHCMPCPQKINIPACFLAYNSSYAINMIAGLQQHIQSSNSTGYAGDCIKCGKCEQLCPQKIRIIESLELVTDRMEPFWYRTAVSLFGVFQKLKSRKDDIS